MPVGSPRLYEDAFWDSIPIANSSWVSKTDYAMQYMRACSFLVFPTFAACSPASSFSSPCSLPRVSSYIGRENGLRF